MSEKFGLKAHFDFNQNFLTKMQQTSKFLHKISAKYFPQKSKIPLDKFEQNSAANYRRGTQSEHTATIT